MADREIVLYYETHRLSALERILTESGSSLENELIHELNDLYKNLVPEDEQTEIESQIERETATENAAREAARRFAVIHFHEGDDDFYFTSDQQNDFYSAAYLYRHYMKDEVGKYTLDSLARHFGEYQTIDELTFSVLCDAMPNDQRITALMDFDFDHGMVSVCESSDNAWWTYDLNDASAAVYRAERKSGLRVETRCEIFSEALAGKEVEMDGEDQDIEKSDSPAMQM